LSNGLKFSGHKVVGTIFTGLAVCGAAQWFTLPWIAGAFGRISLLSPLANLVAVPLFGLAVWCVVLSLVVGSFWPGGAESVAALGWLLFRFLAGLAGLVSGLSAGFPLGLPVPGLGVLIVWVILTLLGVLVLHRHGDGKISGRKALVLVLAVIGMGLAAFGPLRWNLRSPAMVIAWQFDVGQGDCSLMVFPDGWTVLIDTGGRYGYSGEGTDGPFPRTVLPFLQRQGLTGIDAVVLTHGHLDHTGGAAALADAMRVDRWYVSGQAGQSLASVVDSTSIIHPEAGHLLHRWHDWSLAVVYPPTEVPGRLHENDWSLVLVLRRGDRDLAVWSGDLELAGERLMLTNDQAPRDIQVWKAGHHGSDTSGSINLLARFDPALILLSCGVGNTFGHPSHGPYVVRGDTVAIARTDLQGSILMEWDPEGRLRWRSMACGFREISLP
jgi:competence protein ComEC